MAPPRETSDVIVVGLGAMGSSTCLQLARRGVSVIGVDQHHAPHAHGSTHGDTRITRLAIGEGPDYVPLVQRSHDLWRVIELEAGVELVNFCGGLILGEPGNHFLEQTRACARQFGIDHEDLSTSEVKARFPAFANGERTEGYYERTAGYVRPEAAVQAQLRLAAAHGARLRLGERALSWHTSRAGVAVTTDWDTYSAAMLVLCVGAWIPRLFADAGETFAVYRQLMYWFAIGEGYEQLRQMPVFVWDFGGHRDPFVHFHGFYGFPAIDGPEGGVKVGTETYRQTTSADRPPEPATSHEADEMYRRYVKRGLPWLRPELLRSAPCLYTSTRDSRFVIDRHPAHENVWIIAPCSGHGFKHSPAIGEAVAQQITAGGSDLDLSPFALSRSRR